MSNKTEVPIHVVTNRPRLIKFPSSYNAATSAYDLMVASEREEEAIYWLLNVREVGNNKKRGICLVVNISVK